MVRDCCGPHPRPVLAQVGYLEAVDAMVGQLVKQLWQAELEGKGPFALCITGDHSTPVEFGDHSHEPVPIAIAHIRFVLPSSIARCSLAELFAMLISSSLLPGTWWMP